jgi:class 3 adenylate cyclase/tetratricopeptide (TPR) repeat protein
MRCTKCGIENTADARFCTQCATPLPRTCPKCGHPNAADAKFCSQCAAALGERATGSIASAAPRSLAAIRVTTQTPDAPFSEEGERKTLTALFADIKGSMDLIEDLDPEEARAIVDPALKLMIEAVHRYDGYIVQSTGDGIFALFGAPVAHEDHPQRALYAALRIQQELRRHADKLREHGQPPLSVRIGVNTGEVVVRSIQTGDAQTEYTPIGHSISLASRLQTLASPGSVVIGASVQKFVEGYFTLKPLGASKIKGVSEPVPVFEVTGLGPLRTRLQRSAGRGLSKFVGRQAEMDALKRAAEQAAAGRGQIVAAMAEAGVGKSRLFFEFEATTAAGWMVLKAFSVSHGKASAYLPVIDLLHGYFKITIEDDARTRREKVAGRIAMLDRALEDTLPYLFGLLGVVEGDNPIAQMDMRIRQERTHEAIKRILLRESFNQPLMVIFEDLHWIDQETQAVLNLLADSIATVKILLIVNYRPEYIDGWSGRSYYTGLRLEPLGKESADEMLGALLGGDAALASLKRLVAERTEGNPFFMEEMIQTLFEDGALVRNGTVKLTRTLDNLKIPATVQGILAARIDRLAPVEKDMLQTLSVVGREFPLRLVDALIDQSDDQLQPLMDNLQLAEFIYEQPTGDDLEYSFKHALTQQVAYNSVLIERRKILHQKVAAAIEAIHAEHLDDHLTELVFHYSLSSNLAKTTHYLSMAANQAVQRSLFSEAIGFVNRGLELVGAMPEGDGRARDELQLLMTHGVALMVTKGFFSQEVERTFSKACELARRVDDSGQLFFALQGVWGFHYTRGNIEKALEIAEESMIVAHDLNDDGTLRQAHYALGSSFQQIGQIGLARDHLERALPLNDYSRPAGGLAQFGPDLRVLCLSSLSDLLFALGYPDQSLRRGYEAMEVVKRESDPFSFAMAMLTAIQVHCARGEGERGEELCHEAIQLCSQYGFPFWLNAAHRCLGWAKLRQGRVEEGIDIINEQLRQDSAADDELAAFNLFPMLAEAYCWKGELGRARSALEQWLSMRAKHSLSLMDKTFWRIRGELLIREGSLDEGERSLRDAILLSAQRGSKIEELRSTTALARLLAKQDRRDEARAMLADIYKWFTEGFDTADLKSAKALLDVLNG